MLFSPATLARAERAKLYFELCHEYRRALNFLPPIRTDSAGMNKEQVQLGRKYNPLQVTRNRKVRMRERQTLKSKEAGWSDVRNVTVWVDALEDTADQPDIDKYDVVPLPKWNHDEIVHYFHRDRGNASSESNEVTSSDSPSSRKTGNEWRCSAVG